MTLSQPTIIRHPARDYSDRKGKPIAAIVIHATAGTNSLGWLSGNPSGTSIHVLISKDGTCYQMVEDQYAAHHVGFSRMVFQGDVYSERGPSPNLITLGIELENVNDGKDPYPHTQLQAAAWWVMTWRQRYGNIPVVMHRDIDQHGKTDAAGLTVDQILALIAIDPTPPDGSSNQPGLIVPETSILATTPRATADQCVRAINQRGVPSSYSAIDVRFIVDAYFLHGAQAGVDPLLAIAQMIHETGNLSSWWSQRPRRNPAGIGVTGETSRNRYAPGEGWSLDDRSKLWKRGYSFASWNASVQAHLGHLLLYAVSAGQETDAQRTYIAADPRSTGFPATYRGVAPSLVGLNGRWAVPGTTYASSLAAIANAIRVL